MGWRIHGTSACHPGHHPQLGRCTVQACETVSLKYHSIVQISVRPTSHTWHLQLQGCPPSQSLICLTRADTRWSLRWPVSRTQCGTSWGSSVWREPWPVTHSTSGHWLMFFLYLLTFPSPSLTSDLVRIVLDVWGNSQWCCWSQVSQRRYFNQSAPVFSFTSISLVRDGDNSRCYIV